MRYRFLHVCSKHRPESIIPHASLIGPHASHAEIQRGFDITNIRPILDDSRYLCLVRMRLVFLLRAQNPSFSTPGPQVYTLANKPRKAVSEDQKDVLHEFKVCGSAMRRIVLYPHSAAV